MSIFQLSLSIAKLAVLAFLHSIHSILRHFLSHFVQSLNLLLFLIFFSSSSSLYAFVLCLAGRHLMDEKLNVGIKGH